MALAKWTSMLAAKDECYARVIDLPGVFATSVGFRYSDGIRTDELAICVHLLKKNGRCTGCHKLRAYHAPSTASLSM